MKMNVLTASLLISVLIYGCSRNSTPDPSAADQVMGFSCSYGYHPEYLTENGICFFADPED